MEFTRVDGKYKGEVVLYAISTCIWCKKTKRILNKLGIEYRYIDVDLLPEDEKAEVEKEVLKWKEHAIYPLIVIDNEKCIPQYDAEKMKRELG